MTKLPLAAAWICGSRDAMREETLGTLREVLESHADHKRGSHCSTPYDPFRMAVNALE